MLHTDKKKMCSYFHIISDGDIHTIQMGISVNTNKTNSNNSVIYIIDNEFTYITFFLNKYSTITRGYTLV